jgi:hypothetical protein
MFHLLLATATLPEATGLGPDIQRVCRHRRGGKNVGEVVNSSRKARSIVLRREYPLVSCFGFCSAVDYNDQLGQVDLLAKATFVFITYYEQFHLF